MLPVPNPCPPNCAAYSPFINMSAPTYWPCSCAGCPSWWSICMAPGAGAVCGGGEMYCCCCCCVPAGAAHILSCSIMVSPAAGAWYPCCEPGGRCCCCCCWANRVLVSWAAARKTGRPGGP